jgi:putative transferase (TIGR04331 family)
MKANFLVSAHAAARIAGAPRYLAADPYVADVLHDAAISIVPAQRTTREAFQRDHDFVDAKYRKYLPLLAARLDEIHATRHGVRYWQKALSLALLRHITFCYDLFQACETGLRVDEHDCRLLAEASFHVPADFNEHRRFFQHSDFGQEQLFATYARLFHPGRFAEYADRFEWPASPPAAPVHRSLRGQLARLHPRRLARRALRLRRPTVAVVNSYFSQDNFDALLFRSRGRIQQVVLPPAPRSAGAPDWAKRDVLSHPGTGFDRFDRFAFAALRHAMPRSFVEGFAASCAHHEALLRRVPDAKWIVCEAWIGDCASARFLADAAEAGKRHLYNEHNYLGHPFLGNNLKYIQPLVDEFATLGWSDARAPNLVRAASLFPWVDDAAAGPREDILYVASIPLARAPEVNASYGESGRHNAPSYLSFIRAFFLQLSDATMARMVLRKYPARHAKVMQAYDMERALGDQFARMKREDQAAPSARTLMRGARLVVADYISTAYLEALMADVPVVFFWNREAYRLEARFARFFDGLQDAGICHSDPAAAARFVEEVQREPQAWWQSPKVREARRAFLAENLGPAEQMIQLLLRRCAA